MKYERGGKVWDFIKEKLGLCILVGVAIGKVLLGLKMITEVKV